MASRFIERVERWCDLMGVDAARRPDCRSVALGFPGETACRPGLSSAELDDWERRYEFFLPAGLKTWLMLSDGLFARGPLIHPLSAIGPMVPFARVRGLVMQPESWFELGNPNLETVCIDLGYRRPGGGHTVFTSGDDERSSSPRIIASSFDAWFLRVLREGGREYWFDEAFDSLGDPWHEHRRQAPIPELSERLRPIAHGVLPMIEDGVDDRTIAVTFGISPFDVEAIVRHVQHTAPPLLASPSRRTAL